MFAVANVTGSGATLDMNFAYGGFQEARGGDIRPGTAFYVDNVWEELGE